MVYVPKMVVEAVTLVLFLDGKRQSFTSASICASYLGPGTTFHYALKLLQPLGVGRVLSTRRGRNGGYKLVRAIEDITVAETWGCFPAQRLKIDGLSEVKKIMRLVERETRQSLEQGLGSLTVADLKREIKGLAKAPVETVLA